MHGDTSGSRLVLDRRADGIALMAASFRAEAFSPHSHDGYAVGFTTHGVQVFSYRGETRQTVTRRAYVLHPDERHDGRPGTAEGFGCRTAYIDPLLIRDALGNAPLPFLADPVVDDPRVIAAIRALVAEAGEVPIADPLWRTSRVGALADALCAAGNSTSNEPRHRPPPLDLPALKRARTVLEEEVETPVSAGRLEAICGLSRWELARQFRRAFGVSPYRFHLSRRIDAAARLIRAGTPLADAAAATGFADQAHFTRQFRRAHGLSPGHWRRLTDSRPCSRPGSPIETP